MYTECKSTKQPKGKQNKNKTKIRPVLFSQLFMNWMIFHVTNGGSLGPRDITVGIKVNHDSEHGSSKHRESLCVTAPSYAVM